MSHGFFCGFFFPFQVCCEEFKSFDFAGTDSLLEMSVCDLLQGSGMPVQATPGLLHLDSRFVWIIVTSGCAVAKMLHKENPMW